MSPIKECGRFEVDMLFFSRTFLIAVGLLSTMIRWFNILKEKTGPYSLADVVSKPVQHTHPTR